MIVMSVREMCVEWSGGFPPVNDPAMQGQKDPKGGFNIEVRKLYLLSSLCGQKDLKDGFNREVLPLYHSKHFLDLVGNFRFRGETPAQAALSCTW